LAIIRLRIRRIALKLGALENPTVQCFRLPAHFPRMRPPSFWSGSICHLPPTRVGRLRKTAFSWNRLLP